MGAALTTWYKFGGAKSKIKTEHHDHAYWGPSFTNEYIGKLLDKEKEKIKEEKNCEISYVKDFSQLSNTIASKIKRRKNCWMVSGSYGVGTKSIR